MPSLDECFCLVQRLRVASPNLTAFKEIIDMLKQILNIEYIPQVVSQRPLFWKHKGWIIFGIVSGAILVVCDNFSSMAMIMSAFFTVGHIIFWMSIGFALLSLVFFLCYQYALLTHTEQSSWLSMPKLLQQDIEEKKQLTDLVFLLNHPALDRMYFCTDQMKSIYSILVQHVNTRQKALEEKAQVLKQAQTTTWAVIRNHVICVGVGVWIFSSSFFVESSIISSALSLLSLSIPTIGLLSLAALLSTIIVVLFWIGSRQELLQVLNRWSGVDQEWIEILSAPLAMIDLNNIHIPGVESQLRFFSLTHQPSALLESSRRLNTVGLDAPPEALQLAISPVNSRRSTSICTAITGLTPRSSLMEESIDEQSDHSSRSIRTIPFSIRKRRASF